MSDIITKKKRGRKPKNFSNSFIKVENSCASEEPVNTEDEKIIFHLPITINEINNPENKVDLDLFIASEKDLNIKTSNDSDSTDTSKTSLIFNKNEPVDKIIPTNNINKIVTHVLKITPDTKCWWCRNSFDWPGLKIPDDYYNDTFYCRDSNFCSWNCEMAYNLDLNDSLTWKRASLINLLYYKTYGTYVDIKPAPHWMTLAEYGGNLLIKEFRENSLCNTKEFLILHPPLISRQMQIEESYKLSKLKEVPIDKINKIYSEVESDYTIKRSKPIQSSQLNLETTMGLIKNKSKKAHKLLI